MYIAREARMHSQLVASNYEVASYFSQYHSLACGAKQNNMIQILNKLFIVPRIVVIANKETAHERLNSSFKYY